MKSEINLTQIERTQGVDRRVVEVYRLLKQYADAPERAAWKKRREEAWDAIENEMWTDGEKSEMAKQGQIPLVINKLVKGVQGACALVTSQKPQIDFKPIGSGDLYVAELLKRAHDAVWTSNDGNGVAFDFVEEAKIGGLPWLYARLNRNKGFFGRVEFEDLDPLDVYIDPKSRKRDFSDTPVLIARKRSRKYLKETYGKDLNGNLLDFRADAGDSDEEQDSEVSSHVAGADNYARTETVEGGSRDQDEPKTIWEIEAWLLRTMTEHKVVKMGPDGSPQVFDLDTATGQSPKDAAREAGGELWTRTVEKRVMVLIVGGQMMPLTDDDDGEGEAAPRKQEILNPYGEDSDGDPILPIVGLKHQRTRNAYPMSPTQYAREINREKNKRRAQFIHAVSHNVNAPIIEPSTGFKWIGNPGTPGSRGQYDKSLGPNAVTRLTPGAFQATHFLQLEMQADRDIDDQYDLHDVMRGKMPDNEKESSGRAIMALQDLGGIMSNPFLSRLEEALVRLGKANMAIVLRNWPRFMWERLMEDEELLRFVPSGAPEQSMMQEAQPEDPGIQAQIQAKWMEALEKIRPEDPGQDPDISMLDLDVRIVAGSSMPTNRMAREQVAIEKMQAGIYDVEAVLDYTDDPKKDEILARLEKQNQMEAQMAASGAAGK